MLRKIMYYSALLLFFLPACTSTRTTHDINPAFSDHQYNHHDISMVWRAEKNNTDIRIVGTLTNTRIDTPYEGFELTATLLDERGNTLAKDTFKVAPGPLVGSQPFRLDIPVENKELLQHIKFFYTYGLADDHFSGTFTSLP
ncbi:hypothetical protein [Oryzomonas rubra]|uniref:Lipoprotein n=2 Tax=Oryzomonas TaxID=2855184 RepID=A0A5A9XBG4_9BACT|nr:hypothetical protein [Oryzomonas rubra]KAA0889011.1 hypothetical protein ET418_14245 [Oryzomonas rubra]